MHKSRLGVVVIDCQDEKLDDHETFWVAVLGRSKEEGSKDPKYRDLAGPESELRVLLQSVSHTPRVHLDIETDDIPAEVERLKKLGATEVAAVKGWVVTEAPSGHRFCVVKPQRPDFADNANVWNG